MSKIFSTKSLFIVLMVFSFLALSLLLFPDIGSLIGPFILVLWAVLALSGIGLVISTIRDKVQGKTKFFLLSSGFSAIGFFLGVILHNVFYALGTLSEDFTFLASILDFFEVIFFFMAVIICPIGLLVGMVGSIAYWRKIESHL